MLDVVLLGAAGDAVDEDGHRLVVVGAELVFLACAHWRGDRRVVWVSFRVFSRGLADGEVDGEGAGVLRVAGGEEPALVVHDGFFVGHHRPCGLQVLGAQERVEYTWRRGLFAQVR